MSGLGVLDTADIEIQFVVETFYFFEVFCAAIGEQADNSHGMFLEEEKDSEVEHVGCRDRRFGSMNFRCSSLGIGVHNGLLIDASNNFH